MEAKCLCSAMINNLPPAIIETILSLLSFKEAARTSILSRDWKYHWTKISKLDFVANAVKASRNDDDEVKERLSQANRNLFHVINQVMAVHEGPIHEFSLSTYSTHGPCVDFDHVIDNLSRKDTVKKLTLDMPGYWLPESLFSLHKLTDLYLDRCRLDVQPTFSGFGSLANLYMENVIITKKMLLLFLSSCPLLKTVILNPNFGSFPDIDSSAIEELLECLPVIENLTIHLLTLKDFAQGRVPNKLPAPLLHLKYLCIRDTCMAYEYRILCYALLIRSSPNLEKLKLVIFCDLRYGLFEKRENYSDMWLEHLNELEIELWTKRRYRLDFVKLILAKSPVLKKLKILLWSRVTKAEESKMKSEISGIFLQSPRVSPMVEIVVEKGVKPRRPYNRGL
ncbi:putative F-box domain, FBD domain, F-box-like domain superfamily protein [Helianthus anomalus]